ncbi:hypothetical protein EV672_101132 [Aquabacterium commune]|uniref:Uncharacterized protein n=1 Tax=Aquabacterium commune TaxID=70586 RepID=A0A4R6RPH3_9BURK|nr:hypothetical protein EV672_101132 [Aquabacterium commune]
MTARSTMPPTLTPKQEEAHKESLQKTKDRIAKLTPEQKASHLRRWADKK